MAENGIDAPRALPHDISAEMGVLGSMLLSTWAIEIAKRNLGPNPFYKPIHQDIYEAMVKMEDKNKGSTDLITLRDELKKQEKLERAGGAGYLQQLMEAVPTSSNVEYYINILNENSFKREVIKFSWEAQQKASDESSTPEEIQSKLLDYVNKLKAPSNTLDIKTIEDGFAEYKQMIEDVREGDISFVKTGLPCFDDKYGGIQPGDFAVIVAYRSVGKTALMSNIAWHNYYEEEKNVAVFSSEVMCPQYSYNIARTAVTDELHYDADGTFDNKTNKRWREAEKKLGEPDANFYVEDESGITVEKIISMSNQLVDEKGVELICVDYAQILDVEKRVENENLKIGHIAQSLKRLANNKGVPVILLSQRTDKEGRRKTFYGVQLEQAADILIYLEREKDEYEKKQEEEPPACGRNLCVTKYRSKATSKRAATFLKPELKFLPHDDYLIEEYNRIKGKGEDTTDLVDEYIEAGWDEKKQSDLDFDDVVEKTDQEEKPEEHDDTEWETEVPF